ncbi:TPA: LysR family transcriptional regulator [Yersinia enterocolitica]|uniref:DNA-binding transcriptional regulator YafC n=1 Tax=Yersinia enterocolitica TaxID=630 RepID=UPI0002E1A476|nr:DNA-binding transcriptional regulator YafC [Yersinia enterocolitica]HEF7271526.1 LysR family transcriptional regulator [Yersinia enterocolitica]HEI6726406.1 LysR family transcriptional regulator [Yersinia enterocolitica]HEI6761122.1 LysR family transcriptional regulator [Yersinia enterocolitica]HEI6825710.1 LysR family transcriptional regulator [Yersinia enterocolitica]HEI6869637.1 LysR family transcriptional regulator [Yersinia enterocolitica]
MKANSDELITFVTVVECGSFSRAAEQLEQANSVVSRTVKKLENKLGVTLLNRTTRQISLTQEGEHYFRRVQNILREMAMAENEILDNHLNPKGLLRIDAATPVVLHIIAPLMAEFRQRYPLVTLSLVSSETFINLIERKVDIAIRVGTLQDSTLRARKLMTSYRHILASPAYLKQYGTPQTAADLENHLCLGFNDLPTLNRWPLAGADGQLYEIKSDLASNNGETQRRLCLEGNGIACLSDFMVQQDLQRGDLVPILQEHTLPVAMPINAVYYSDQAVSNRLRCFIDFINERLISANPTK